MTRKKIIAVASGGGHWVQLLCLENAFNGHEVIYVSVEDNYRSQVIDKRYYVFTDANKNAPLKLLKLMLESLVLVIKEKPDIVITTGAAVGVFPLMFSKVLGAKTIWIDSIANTAKLSLSARLVKRSCDVMLTQWEHLSEENSVEYVGSVL